MIFSGRSWVFGIEDVFRTRYVSHGQPAGWPAGWLSSQQKVPPSPGLIIIVMIVKLLIISSISTISFIHICNMNDINNNTVWIYHNGRAILVRPWVLLIPFMLQIWI